MIRRRLFLRRLYVNQTHAQGENTALMCAIEKGRSDCVRLLLDAGADKEAKDKVRASAHRVCGLMMGIDEAAFLLTVLLSLCFQHICVKLKVCLRVSRMFWYFHVSTHIANRCM